MKQRLYALLILISYISAYGQTETDQLLSTIAEFTDHTNQAQQYVDKAQELLEKFRAFKNRYYNRNELDLTQIDQNWVHGIVHNFQAARDLMRYTLRRMPQLQRTIDIYQATYPQESATTVKRVQELDARMNQLFDESNYWLHQMRHRYPEVQLPPRIQDDLKSPAIGHGGSGNVRGKQQTYRN